MLKNKYTVHTVFILHTLILNSSNKLGIDGNVAHMLPDVTGNTLSCELINLFPLAKLRLKKKLGGVVGSMMQYRTVFPHTLYATYKQPTVPASAICVPQACE